MRKTIVAYQPIVADIIRMSRCQNVTTISVRYLNALKMTNTSSSIVFTKRQKTERKKQINRECGHTKTMIHVTFSLALAHTDSRTRSIAVNWALIRIELWRTCNLCFAFTLEGEFLYSPKVFTPSHWPVGAFIFQLQSKWRCIDPYKVHKTKDETFNNTHLKSIRTLSRRNNDLSRCFFSF